jgi:hypothetical protein
VNRRVQLFVSVMLCAYLVSGLLWGGWAWDSYALVACGWAFIAGRGSA